MVKYDGGSVMLREGFSAAGTAKLVRIEKRLNAAKYKEALENLLQRAHNLKSGTKKVTL